MQYWNIFVSCPGWFSFKFVQRFQFHAEFWFPWQPKGTKSCQKLLGSFVIIWHKWSLGDTLPRLFKLYWSVKNMAARGQGQFFPLYVSIGKVLKIFLSKSTGQMEIICHKWSLGDPLPKLFKLYRPNEKHGCHGSVSHKPWIRFDALLDDNFNLVFTWWPFIFLKFT